MMKPHGEQMEKTRILVCSVSCWSSLTGADTFSALLSGHTPDCVANLYIREQIPDSLCCGRYFQISENKVLKSIAHRHMPTGQTIFPDGRYDDNIENAGQTQRRYMKLGGRYRPWMQLMRELVWKFGRWKTAELDAFLREFDPEIILIEMSGYIHFSNICRYAVKRCGVPAVGFFWDDNFTYKQYPLTPGYLAHRTAQRRSLMRLSEKCAAFFAISPKTKQECDAVFGTDCTVLTKPADYAPSEEWQPYESAVPIRMLYAGNLAGGRYETLLAIGGALKELNCNGCRVRLEVYTQTLLSDNEKSALGEDVCFEGAAAQSTVLALQKEADVLLFLEALDGPYKNVARLSFSTKLTDYMKTGRCIWAVGNPALSPMQYLASADAALCAGSVREIAEQLRFMVDSPRELAMYGQRAFELGKRVHNREREQGIFYGVLQKARGTQTK